MLDPGGTVPAHLAGTRKEAVMPAWLLLIIVGVVLLILGIAITAAKFLIWIGIAVLVVSLILGLLRRSRV